MVKQELLFVGQESGKLIAIRDIIHKVVKGLRAICSLINVGWSGCDPGIGGGKGEIPPS